MKALKYIVVLAIFAGFAASAYSQAVVFKDRKWFINDGYKLYWTTTTHEVLCPDGTINAVIDFQFDSADPWVPEKGVRQYSIYSKRYGVMWLYIHQKGKATLYIHYDPDLG